VVKVHDRCHQRLAGMQITFLPYRAPDSASATLRSSAKHGALNNLAIALHLETVDQAFPYFRLHGLALDQVGWCDYV
jgi:hypothetical protein